MVGVKFADGHKIYSKLSSFHESLYSIDKPIPIEKRTDDDEYYNSWSRWFVESVSSIPAVNINHIRNAGPNIG